ncbi:hypothetical protein FBU30_008284 [Linnemannia zychae]|nr:hypothetical protein FBU30_008284 [Linnemannia zychae]
MSGRQKTLFISGFSQRSRARDLAYEFERFGPLVRCDIPALRASSSRPYAFVEYEDERDAKDAYDEMRDVRFEGYRLSVQFAKNSPNASWRYERRGGRDRSRSPPRRGRFPPRRRSSPCRRSSYSPRGDSYERKNHKDSANGRGRLSSDSNSRSPTRKSNGNDSKHVSGDQGNGSPEDDIDANTLRNHGSRSVTPERAASQDNDNNSGHIRSRSASLRHRSISPRERSVTP